MALTIKLTSAMSAGEMAEHWPDIIRCLERYVSRYPRDESVTNILQQCATGRRQLWIILDETGRVVLTPITEIAKVEATGHKRLVMVELGGWRGVEALPLAAEIERWAVETHGVEEVEWVGRRGWAKLIEPLGFKPQAIIWRKRIGT
jgi:hypothetical protein